MRNFTIATIIVFAISLAVFSYAFLVYQQPVEATKEIEQQLLATENSSEIITNHYVAISGEVDRIDTGPGQYTIALIKEDGEAFNFQLNLVSNVVLRQCTPDSRCPDFSSYSGSEIVTNGYIFRELDVGLIEVGDRLDIFQTRELDRSVQTVYLTRYQEIINE